MKTIERITITPELAKEWLEKYNVHNRKISTNHVQLLADEMTAGRFKDNGDVFRFNEEGILIDGQHRLLAIVKSGVSLIDAIVVRGLKAEIMDTIDSGKIRSCADKAQLSGVCGKDLTAVARSRFYYYNGDLGANIKYSDLVIIDFVKKNKDLLHEAYSLSRKAYTQSLKIMPAPYAAILSIGLEHDRSKTVEFAQKVASGEGLKEGDACLALRRFIIKNTAERGHWDRRSFCNGVIIAMNAFFSDKKIRSIRTNGENVCLFFAPVEMRNPAGRIPQNTKKIA